MSEQTELRVSDVNFFRKSSWLKKNFRTWVLPVSEVLSELTKLLEVKLKQANLKHPQHLGVVERSHSAHNQILKLKTIQQRNISNESLQLATFLNNRSSRSAISCSPTVLSHGCEPLNPLDLRFSNTLIEHF